MEMTIFTQGVSKLTLFLTVVVAVHLPLMGINGKGGAGHLPEVYSTTGHACIIIIFISFVYNIHRNSNSIGTKTIGRSIQRYMYV